MSEEMITMWDGICSALTYIRRDGNEHKEGIAYRVVHECHKGHVSYWCYGRILYDRREPRLTREICNLRITDREYPRGIDEPLPRKRVRKIKIRMRHRAVPRINRSFKNRGDRTRHDESNTTSLGDDDVFLVVEAEAVVRCTNARISTWVLDICHRAVESIPHPKRSRPEYRRRSERALVEERAWTPPVYRGLSLILDTIETTRRHREIPVRNRSADDNEEKYSDSESVEGATT